MDWGRLPKEALLALARPPKPPFRRLKLPIQENFKGARRIPPPLDQEDVPPPKLLSEKPKQTRKPVSATVQARNEYPKLPLSRQLSIFLHFDDATTSRLNKLRNAISAPDPAIPMLQDRICLFSSLPDTHTASYIKILKKTTRKLDIFPVGTAMPAKGPPGKIYSHSLQLNHRSPKIVGIWDELVLKWEMLGVKTFETEELGWRPRNDLRLLSYLEEEKVEDGLAVLRRQHPRGVFLGNAVALSLCRSGKTPERRIYLGRRHGDEEVEVLRVFPLRGPKYEYREKLKRKVGTRENFFRVVGVH